MTVSEQTLGMQKELASKYKFFKERDDETGLIFRVLDQVIAVVNKIEPVFSAKPLEIYYHVPHEDEVLEAVRQSICFAWLNNVPATRDFDRSMAGRFGVLGKDYYSLQLPFRGLATRAQREDLFDLGINALCYNSMLGTYLDGDRIWKQGHLVKPSSFPTRWDERATMAIIAQQISYAEMLTVENRHWLNVGLQQRSEG